MFDKKDLNESELEDTEVLTPEKEEVDEVNNEFTAIITLDSELIESKSIQEITTVLDNELRAIREAAIKRLTELKN